MTPVEWQTTERVLESGAFESKRRMSTDAPVVESSESGARWLGVTYWRAVSEFSRGVLEATFGAQFDAGVPEIMTYRQIIERIAKVRGRRIVLIEVPVLTPRLSSLWLHLVTPVNASVAARPLIEGLRNPTVAHEERLRTLIPFDLKPFDLMARQALSEAQSSVQLNQKAQSSVQLNQTT